MRKPISKCSLAAPVLLATLVLGIAARPASAQNAAVALSRAGASATHPSDDRPAPAVEGSGEDLAQATNRQPDTVKAEARQLFKDFLRDQRAIWTSPLHLDRGDSRWLLPALGISAALLGSDKEINGEVSTSHSSVSASNRVSDIGSGYTLLGAAGTMYVIGHVAHNERARDVGLLGIEAIADEFVVVTAIKAATNRERPEKTNGRQDFFDGGRAFPSGHSAASWAFAAVVADVYHDKPVVRWGAYGLAAAVSIARVTSQKHSPSDVFVGGAIGYLIGRYVAKQRTIGPGHASWSLVPYVDRQTRTVGASCLFRF